MDQQADDRKRHTEEPLTIRLKFLDRFRPRFTTAADYPHGFDPAVADESAADVTAANPRNDGFDLLSVIAPSVANDRAFRAWWDDAGRRGASPNFARAQRTRHTRLDLRDLLPAIAAPVLHLVYPAAVAHDGGHDRYLAATIPTTERPNSAGSDELWWLDPSHSAVSHITRFALASTSGTRLP